MLGISLLALQEVPDSCSDILVDDSTHVQDAVGTGMSPDLHQTPVDAGFQWDDHTPHLARGEGISSEMDKEGKKEE